MTLYHVDKGKNRKGVFACAGNFNGFLSPSLLLLDIRGSKIILILEN